jgi:branched-chain amino acid transport system substrate-binding protein
MKALKIACLAVLLGAATAYPAEAQIKIGVAGPMTGTLSLLGAGIRDGAAAAVAEVNAAGGLLGQEIELEIADDTCSEDRAATVAADLVAAGVVFVVGHLCSAASIAAGAVYAEAGVIQIAPGAPEPRFTEERPGPGAFRLYGRADDQAKLIGEFLAGQSAADPIAIIDDRSPYGRGLAESVLDAMQTLGREAQLTASYTAGNADFPALVGRLREAGVTIIFVGGTAADAAALRLEMAGQDYRPLLIGGDALVDQAFADIAGPEANGTLFAFPPDPAADTLAAPAIAAITDNGGDADGFALYAFAAVEMWSQAVERVGSTDFGRIAGELQTGLFNTALGTAVGFNQIGDMTLPGWAIYQWIDGEYRPLPP